MSLINQFGGEVINFSDGDFSLFFPSTLYNDTILGGTSYFVCSGSFRLALSSSGTYNLSTVYPTYLRSVLTENGTYRNNVDITQFYNSTLGSTRYSSSNVSFVSQTHFLPNSNSLVFSFIFVSSSASRTDTCIDYVIPSFSAALTASEIKTFNVDAPSTAVEDSINTLITSTTSGLGGVETAVNALSSLTQSNFASTEQLLNSLDAAISDLKGSVTDSVYDALDQWNQHELDFVESDLNPLVQGVVDDINDLYDYDTFYGAFNSVVNMVTGGNTRAAPTTRLRIPAGVVTVGGQTYRFWDETYVDFGPVFENDMIQLLLVPFRFLVAYGFLKYCLYWINKLINTITLHIKAGEG